MLPQKEGCVGLFPLFLHTVTHKRTKSLKEVRELQKKLQGPMFFFYIYIYPVKLQATTM